MTRLGRPVDAALACASPSVFGEHLICGEPQRLAWLDDPRLRLAIASTDHEGNSDDHDDRHRCGDRGPPGSPAHVAMVARASCRLHAGSKQQGTRMAVGARACRLVCGRDPGPQLRDRKQASPPAAAYGSAAVAFGELRLRFTSSEFCPIHASWLWKNTTHPHRTLKGRAGSARLPSSRCWQPSLSLRGSHGWSVSPGLGS